MPPTNGSRVTVRELYELILKQNEDRYAMERRIIEKIDVISGCMQPIETKVEKLDTTVKHHKEEIDRLRNKSDRWDAINTFIAIAGSAIAGWLGYKQ